MAKINNKAGSRRSINLRSCIFLLKEEDARKTRSSLLLLLLDLLLEGVGSGEVDGNLVGGEFLVDLGHSIDLSFNLFSVEGVQEDLNVLLAVKGNSG